MNKNKTQTALAALGARLLGTQGNLAAARESAEILLRFLPAPSICDYMVLPTDPPMPTGSLFESSPNSLILEAPRAVFDSFDPIQPAKLPESWMLPFLEYIPRLQRSRWLVHARAQCDRLLHSPKGPMDFSQLDGVVAGLLFFMLQPPASSPLREELFKRASTHKFGMFLASRGMLLDREQLAILRFLARDSRFLLWLSRMAGWAQGCVECGSGLYDLHSGVMMVGTPMGKGWLDGLLSRANDHADAASAALVLQPNAPQNCRELWIETVIEAKSSRLACLTARFARHTWTSQEWELLCSRLKETATRDKGKYWYHWFARVAGPDEASAALNDPDSELLWCLELFHSIQAPDTAIRFRLEQRLAACLSDRESAVAMDSLNSRRQNHP